MDNQPIYITGIYYIDANDQDIHCQCAVRCQSKDEVNENIKAYLSKQDAQFMWSTDIYESIDWFRTFGQMPIQVELVQRIYQDGDSVVLSQGEVQPKVIAEDEQDYLIIEEIEHVEPLDLQFGVHPRLSVPASLHPYLFAEPEPSKEELEHYGDDIPPMQTYAILDGAKMPYLLTGELEHSRLEYQSLFQGQAQEELGEHAPYLVKLEDNNEFTRRLFTAAKPPLGLWEKELGIFIRSRASFAELRNHFRKFTKVQDEAGKWYYFRFWEARYTRAYLEFTNANTAYSFLYKSMSVFYYSFTREALVKISFKEKLEGFDSTCKSKIILNEMVWNAFSKEYYMNESYNMSKKLNIPEDESFDFISNTYQLLSLGYLGESNMIAHYKLVNSLNSEELRELWNVVESRKYSLGFIHNELFKEKMKKDSL